MWIFHHNEYIPLYVRHSGLGTAICRFINILYIYSIYKIFINVSQHGYLMPFLPVSGNKAVKFRKLTAGIRCTLMASINQVVCFPHHQHFCTEGSTSSRQYFLPRRSPWCQQINTLFFKVSKFLLNGCRHFDSSEISSYVLNRQYVHFCYSYLCF